MQTKSQRNRRTQTNRTSEQDVLAKAVEELVREGVYTGETGFRGLIHDVAKSFLQAALQGELTAHLNDEREAAVADAEAEPEQAAGMRANKRVKTDIGEVEIDVPRDRNGTFEPILVPKHARTFGGLDSQLIAMYARGMSTRDISAFVKQQYGINASPEYISTVTDSVLADIESWQSRPLDEVYPVVFFDALRVNIRDGVTVKKMAVHIAIGINARGMRDVLGMWIAENEGASFWASRLLVSKIPWRAGYLDRRHGRPDGHDKGDRDGLPADGAPDVHRALDPSVHRLHLAQGPQGRVRPAQADLRGHGRRGGRACARSVGTVRAGPTLSCSGAGMAARLGAGDPVLQLSARGASVDLHDQLH